MVQAAHTLASPQIRQTQYSPGQPSEIIILNLKMLINSSNLKFCKKQKHYLYILKIGQNRQNEGKSRMT